MANTRYVQVNQAVVHIDVQTNFDRLSAALRTDKGIAIGIAQSYLSEYEVADELRKIVKDRLIAPPLKVKPLLDPAKSIVDIVNEGKYDILKEYLNALSQSDYEPALANSFTSVAKLQVYPIPNKLELDPRRTGRLVRVTPSDSIKGIAIQRWLFDNGPSYGFVLYGDFALYYIGIEKISSMLAKSDDPNKEFTNITTQFIKPSSVLLQLTNTSKKILEGIPPS